MSKHVSLRTPVASIFLAFAILSLTAPSAFAQQYINGTGVPTFATTQPVELGVIDVANGNLHLEVPVASAPQRGQKLGLSAKLVYDSRIWTLVNNGTSQVWQPANVPNSQTGWRYQNGLGSGSLQYDANTLPCPGGVGTYQDYTNFVWTSASGTMRRFPLETKSGCNADVSSGSAFADDGTGFKIWVSSFTHGFVVDPGGVQVYPYFEDTNGNFFWDDGLGNTVDTLGREPVVKTVSGSQTFYDVRNSQGTRSRITVNTGPITVTTAFNVANTTEYSGTLTAVTSIQLPDGTSYQFSYDSYGELSGITLPTGGHVTYTYTNFTDAYGQVNRWVYTRGAAGGSWSYVPGVISTCSGGTQNCQQQVVVNKASGDSILYIFTLNGGAWTSEADYYDPIGTFMAVVATSYDMSNPCSGCSGAAYVKVTRNKTTLVTSGGGFINKKTEYTYASTFTTNVIAKKEWAFTAGTFGVTPDRETDYTYVNDDPHLGYNILNLPSSVTVLNAAGAQVAKTLYSWDQYGTSGLSAASGFVQHDDIGYGLSYIMRGNLTGAQTWVSGTTYLQTSQTWDTTGQVTSSTDSNGNVTSYSYTDAYYNDNGANPPLSTTAPSGPTHAYRTSVTLPIIGAQSTGYYFGTGQKAFDTDQNGATSYYHYVDPFARPTLTVAADGGWSLTSYTSATTTDQYSAINDVTVSTACTSCTHTQTVVDSFGRVQQSALVNDPDGETFTNTTYDTSGRVSTVTNPFRSTTEPTYGSKSLQYDALDRVVSTTKPDGSAYQNLFGRGIASATQLCAAATYGVGYPSQSIDPTGKKKQFWTDGLSRLIEVDEPDVNNNLNVATCYKYDGLDNLVQVAQQAQTRTYSYDGLSRVVSQTIPESGTTSFSYTAGTGLCSGNPSNVCSRVDARNITTTYTYDALGRLLTRVYSDGTPTEGYQYDEATVLGIPLSNTKGRVSHHYVGNVERVFSYDKVGRVTNQWECLPSNCGVSTYNTVAGYDLSGHLKQLTYPSGRQVSYTIGNAGRVTQATLTNAGGQSLNYLYASAIHYSPAGSKTGVTIGNSTTPLSESYTYNKRFQLASGVVSGSVLTAMNHTYTLADVNGHNNGDVLAINDQLSSARTQTFTYDNLDRLGTATETAWGLNYAYDVYGNLLQQNLTLGSAPILNLSVNTSNHITNTGFTYDAAGNLTADGTNTYQYDGASRIKSVNGTAATYTYDVNNLRIIKHVGTDTAEYIIFGSQVLAYHHSANWNDWTDLIYMNGGLLAKADSFEDRLHIHGSNCSNCGSQYSLFTFPNAAGYNGYVVRTGDKLFLRQYQNTGSHGGVVIGFTDNTNTTGLATDQDGQQINNDGTQASWHYRRIDLSSFAGKTINEIDLKQETTTGAGAWDIYYTDMAIFSTDGSVRPIYNRQTSVSLSMSGTTGVTGRMYEVSHLSSESQYPDLTTVFYHTDHLGSSRMRSNVNGYPVWQGTYLPFGYEYNPQITVNNYKFTGYEHDVESGLEYANQRYFASQYARFVTPDVMSGINWNPQSLNKYAYALNNPLVNVDRNGKWPTNIHDGILAAALPGLSTSAMEILQAASLYTDRMDNQGPAGANDHAMCKPGQTLTDCAYAINNIITSGVAGAAAAGYNEKGLWLLGSAIHTITDLTSPYHAAADGTPKCWSCSTGVSVEHFVAEDLVGAVLGSRLYGKQIAQAVLNAQAAFAVAYPAKAQSAMSGAVAAVSGIVSAGLVMNTGSVAPSPVLENEATGCLLGNPAACSDGQDNFFQGIISGGGGAPDVWCLGNRCHGIK